MHHHRDHEGAQKLYVLIKDVKICMMTTIEPDGTLHSRPMYNQEADEAGELWFFTYLRSPKMTEVSKDNHVNLAYADPDKQHYISVSGRAEIHSTSTSPPCTHAAAVATARPSMRPTHMFQPSSSSRAGP